ncbi:hypothetical protein D7X33_08890 [Butyricicoccus sp. 1XD8-22]|nr:hypothetical protein D7X33_08890 [Butyricicoccus sp. 1XD8-22]
MWTVLKTTRKFTQKSELDKIIGAPLFRFEDRPVYYYGGGFAVYYCPKCFSVEGIQRVEYGVPGEYAVGLYHFSDAAVFKMELELDAFEADDVAPIEDDIIDGVVSYRSTFHDIHQWAQKNPSEHCQGGETQTLVDGKMIFKNLFIMYDQYQFYFYGKSKRTKLSGFRFVFNE